MDLRRHRRYTPRNTQRMYNFAQRRGSIGFRSNRSSILKSIWNNIFPIIAFIATLIGVAITGVVRMIRSKPVRKLMGPTILIIGGGAFLVLLYTYITLPDPNVIAQRTVTESTKIYDRTKSVILYDIHEEFKRTTIDLESIPRYAKQATIVAEDRGFYQHSGFDIKGIIRSIVKDIFTLSKAQGGSTITQQLVKNALLTNEKAFTRKIRELLLAYKIEQRFTKDQILKMYFNEIPYGRLAYGIEAASQTYFTKHARDLTLAQAALLAALPQAPSYYSPYGSHKDALIARSQYILKEMNNEGYITEQELDGALKEKLIFAPSRETIIAPHFVFYVRDLLEKEFGAGVVEQGGLIVTTTLDVDRQRIAEEAITNGEAKMKQYNATNAALVSIDPRTGQILTMVGSRDYFNDEIDGRVNVTTRPRQPGSSFKPVVYAAAFEKGYTPDTLLYDVPTVFKNYPQDYEPKNYNGKTYGLLTIRQALAGSLNIPAVKTMYLVGVGKVLDVAERLGYTTLADRSRFSLSLVLGGGEVKLLEHTATFGIFAQEGVSHPTAALLKVEDSSGRVLKEFEDQPKTVIDAEVTRQLTSILSDNNARTYIFGARNNLILPDRPVAAKSGTTNDNHDAWLMGYTPSLVTGVWVGNNNNNEMKAGADGSVVAAPIWNEYMRRALTGTPVEQFTAPQPSIVDKPILRGERPGATTVKIDKASGKLATDRTPASMVEERVYTQAHTILHWVDKDNPRGPVPADPTRDPQYATWEAGVQAFVNADGNAPKDVPPTEFDDVHVPANIPNISIAGLGNNESISVSAATLTISSGSARGVRRIDVMVDTNTVKTILNTPMPTSITEPINLDAAGILQNGQHTLTVIAHDDAENTGSTSITFTVDR